MRHQRNQYLHLSNPLAVLFAAKGIEKVFQNLGTTATRCIAFILLAVAVFCCIPLLSRSKVGGIIVIIGLTFLLGGMVVAPDAWWDLIKNTTNDALKGS